MIEDDEVLKKAKADLSKFVREAYITMTEQGITEPKEFKVKEEESPAMNMYKYLKGLN